MSTHPNGDPVYPQRGTRTLVEAHEATLRLRAETAAIKQQLAADEAAERAGEGRLLPDGRTNFHDS